MANGLRYVGKSAASAALGLIVIGLGMEAYQFVQVWRGRR
jgi:hypothetical protein